ncbi:MAG: type II toxin-antitoxin system VapC family toxin [Kiloniellales bacterium]|nr:type II toxin-antitoxin system VapC family toxin [Kiloniellales bacterium]
MADVVLDASAVLAVLQDEPGADEVWDHLPGAGLSAVNAAEVAAKLVDGGAPPEDASEILERLGMTILPFDAVDIVPSARISHASRALSLGDRACLSLAMRLEVPAVTADRAWAELSTDLDIQLIR